VFSTAWNITLRTKVQAAKSHTKPTDTSKLTTRHFIALQKKKTKRKAMRKYLRR